jgi:hypothetical protein
MGDQWGWGLLGPEVLPNVRRTRTLGLGASVRHFNELAVPGLGGVWFGKQVLLATLGVAVAEEVRKGVNVKTNINNIEVANAIEALACWFAFKGNDKSDARLKGSTKLLSQANFGFKEARQRSFYVTIPMRMQTVQALPALGLVEAGSVRFNAFSCTDQGRQFIKEALGTNEGLKKALIRWVSPDQEKGIDEKHLNILSPITDLLPAARQFLREILIRNSGSGVTERRSNVLKWVEKIQKGNIDSQTWKDRPEEISEDHWHDLQAGALFFKVRVAAIAALEEVERVIGNKSTGEIFSLKEDLAPESLKNQLTVLKEAARDYLKFSSEGDDESAKKFCEECVEDDGRSVLRKLVGRDGHVLRLVGDDIKGGPAFRDLKTNGEENQETPKVGRIPVPEGISYRVRNLYLLSLDMQGKLSEWLKSDGGVTRES